MVSGEVEIFVDDKSKMLLPGNMALLLPGRREFFRFHRTSQSVHIWCQLDFEGIPRRFNERFSRVSTQLPINGEMEQLLELGLSVSASSHINTNMAAIKLGEALLHYYLALDALPETDRPQPMSRVIRKACQFIATHYGQSLRLEDIAGYANCSVNHLINEFRRRFGVTPSRYMWNARIEQSVSLLRQTDIPVASVAEQCGFISPFHYSRMFKMKFSESPRAYRNRYRESTLSDRQLNER